MTKNKIEYVSEYLAKELSYLNFYDVETIKTKIKSGLTILISDEINNRVNEKSIKKVKKHIETTEKKQKELQYWKNIVRSFVKSETEMKKYYSEIENL